MHPTVVLNVVGLTGSLLGRHTPNLTRLASGGVRRPLRTVTPAVTCTVQSTFLTGTAPARHGIVANGWYFRDLAQIFFWRQSNRLVEGEKIWETARRRDRSVTCASLFWWYNMYSGADLTVTPRPIYPADGRKIPDIYSHPASLAERLKADIGDFPFFHFWGPRADILSSRWIAESALRVFDWEAPTLTLVYLPHLDYNLQRLGPDDPALAADLAAIDAVCGRLIDHFLQRGARVIVLSEYGITRVDGPVHINRVLRQAGLLRVRNELGLEALDPGASDAFAVADHQVAHVYVQDPAKIAAVGALLETTPGIEQVLTGADKAAFGLDHPRCGELVAIARPERWFTYYYWLDDAVAPDFARTVDIHRKPGYDPVELFVDPQLRFPKLKIGRILLKKKLGFRYLMDVIPLEAGLVRGSHGRITDDPSEGPLLISSERRLVPCDTVEATAVRDLILDHVFIH
ncbi:MAG: alkaline phosphatase family protein [Acidobacteriota bacterium]